MESIRPKTVRIMQAMLLVALSALLIVTGVAFSRFFDQLPAESSALAIDWEGLWRDIRQGIRYDGTLRNPPWSVLILWPVTQLAMKPAWGVAMYATLVIQVLSVPRTKHLGITVTSVLLLVTSFPAVRNMADGNLEGLVIGGLALIWAGVERAWSLPLAVGILLASAKPQSVALVMPVLFLTLLARVSRPVLIRTVVLVLAIVIPTLIWRGSAWWSEGIRGNIHAGSIMDVSLSATLSRIGVTSVFSFLVIVLVIGVAGAVCWITKPGFSREKIGLLVAGSLLISPYAAGNSLLTVMAFGVIPLFQARPWRGLVLIALINASWWPHLKGEQAAFSNYTTLLLVMIFVALAWEHVSSAAHQVPTSYD